MKNSLPFNAPNDVVATSNPDPYGFCPTCGKSGVARERRMNGNDTCENNHVYPSAQAIPTDPVAIPSKTGASLSGPILGGHSEIGGPMVPGYPNKSMSEWMLIDGHENNSGLWLADLEKFCILTNEKDGKPDLDNIVMVSREQFLVLYRAFEHKIKVTG